MSYYLIILEVIHTLIKNIARDPASVIKNFATIFQSIIIFSSS